MEAKTVVITGATGAIGKATAIELSGKVQNLVLIGRNSEKLNSVKTEIQKMQPDCNIDTVLSDLSEFNTILNAANYIRGKYAKIDALVNIAALFIPEQKENSTGQEIMFATNHLGSFILTDLLMHSIKGAGGKVITFAAPSTTKINFEEFKSHKYANGFSGKFGATKMMNLLFANALARRLEGTGAISIAFHPGLVKSDLTKKMSFALRTLTRLFSGKPDKAAKKIAEIVSNPTIQSDNGKFIRYDGKVLKSSDYSYDLDTQNRLWNLSEQIENNVLQLEELSPVGFR